MGHLNINSVRNKFHINYRQNIDLLLIPLTKLNESFPTAQFQMTGFSVPYRYDRNKKVDGPLLYICDDVQSELLISKSKSNIETLSVATNLRKRKWFQNCSNSPYQNLISNHLECLNRFIHKHSSSFDSFIFMGGSNASTNHN